MARTKTGKSNPSPSEAQQEFLKQADARFHKIQVHFDGLIQELHNDIDMILFNLPPEIKNLTVGELQGLVELDNNKNVTPPIPPEPLINVIPPSTEAHQRPGIRQTAVSTDGGYDTETNSQESKAKHVSRAHKALSTSKRPVGRPKRSSSSSESRQGPSLRSSTRTVSTSRADKFQTPATSRNQVEYNPVTPKVKPNTPMSILRIPRAGEMALSMQGSPLLVSAVSSRTANVNVPLHNGNIISLLPNDGLRMSSIPNLDESTLRQLQTLKGHIEKVIGNR